MSPDEMQVRARAVSRTEFVAEHPYPFLLVHGTAGAGALPFSTNVSATSELANQAPPEIFAVQKSSANPYSDRISIGRARNCDIVLRDASVSKLHAHFVADGKGGFTLVDQSSRNGITLNNRPLKSGQLLVSGDELVFGSVMVEFLDAIAIHQMFASDY